jgi:hypothetical protein
VDLNQSVLTFLVCTLFQRNWKQNILREISKWLVLGYYANLPINVRPPPYIAAGPSFTFAPTVSQDKVGVDIFVGAPKAVGLVI